MNPRAVTITLPVNGSLFDYQMAISNAITASAFDPLSQAALSGLMAYLNMVPQAGGCSSGASRSDLVYGKA